MDLLDRRENLQHSRYDRRHNAGDPHEENRPVLNGEVAHFIRD
jgi:hypothetical protein